MTIERCNGMNKHPCKAVEQTIILTITNHTAVVEKSHVMSMYACLYTVYLG